jgi:nucleotide-binding universal stress UspA family protein
MGKIVVGVDASSGALQALTWAADEARLRLATLEVVHAYHAQALAAPLYFPSQEALPGRATGGQLPPDQQRAETAKQQAEFQAAVRRQSVSHAAVLHARCPVVIIPAAADRKALVPPV